MIPQTELDLGYRASERERYVIRSIELYLKNTSNTYFRSSIPEAMSGNSGWGHLNYPQNKDFPKKKEYLNTIFRNTCLHQAFDDLIQWGIFKLDPQCAYTMYGNYYKIRKYNLIDIQFGLLASKRTYRVLTEISKFPAIKDYKLFGHTRTLKKYGDTNHKTRLWASKIRGYYYIEIDDLIELGMIRSTDGSKGYKTYSITEHGKKFMEKNQQWMNEEYRI